MLVVCIVKSPSRGLSPTSMPDCAGLYPKRRAILENLGFKKRLTTPLSSSRKHVICHESIQWITDPTSLFHRTLRALDLDLRSEVCQIEFQEVCHFFFRDQTATRSGWTCEVIGELQKSVKRPIEGMSQWKRGQEELIRKRGTLLTC